jgi:Txe/YoeB family toxin of Txe-Axe toxin-antitoxin module
MSVNIVDISELIAQEGKQAKKYEELIEKAQDEGFKSELTELRDLSVKKLNLLVKIVKEGPWGNWE